MQVPPWHMRRHISVFVPDRKVLTPKFVSQAGCCREQRSADTTRQDGGMAACPAAGGEHTYPQPRSGSAQHRAGSGVCSSSCCGSAELPCPHRLGRSRPPCAAAAAGGSRRCSHHAVQATSHKTALAGGAGSVQPGWVVVRGWTRGRTRYCTRVRVALEESRPSSV